MENLYDDEFIKSLPTVDGKWKAPLISYIVSGKSEYNNNLRKLILEWYEKIPDNKKLDSYRRLRSTDDTELRAKINEFLVAEFCSNLGEIEFDPTIEEDKTPDILWRINKNLALIDVVTLSDEKNTKEEQHDIDNLLNYLKSVQNDKYDVIVEYENINRNLKKKEIKNIIERYLEQICKEEIKIYTLPINRDDFNGIITFIPRKSTDTRNLEFGVSSPARCIVPLNSIRKRIKQKLSKYKWNGPVFVAICSNSSFGCDCYDVAEVLYGKETVSYNFETGETFLTIDGSGILMPDSKGKILNTSLTGVLHCEYVSVDNTPKLKVKYLMNPFAKFKVDINIPTYPVLEGNKISFVWSNTK